MNLKIHHFGYLVKHIEEALKVFQQMGYVCTGKLVRDMTRKIDILFLRKDGIVVELIAPQSQESPYYPLLARYRNAIYHICYETEQFETDIAALQEAGFRCTEAPAKAAALDGRRVAFYVHPQMGIVEILEIYQES